MTESPMPRSAYPFQSEVDNRYYFWLGTGLQGPFDDYNEAHATLTAAIEAAKNKE
jgi:hypothetical protein